MKSHTVLLAATLLALSSGCTNIASSRSGQTTVNGEAWYVKTTYFLVIPVGNSIFYCPPPQGRGTPTCTEALMHEENVAMTQPAAQSYPPPAAEQPLAPAVVQPPAPPPEPPASTPALPPVTDPG